MASPTTHQNAPGSVLWSSAHRPIPISSHPSIEPLPKPLTTAPQFQTPGAVPARRCCRGGVRSKGINKRKDSACETHLRLKMFKQVITEACSKRKCLVDFKNSAICLVRSRFHSGQVLSSSSRSFFGVEDFLDDDNSRPYTYQKGKKSKNPQKHVSFKNRTIAYMEPFSLDVFISKRFISASVTHRVTCKQVAVAGTNSKDIKAVLKSRSDIPACLAVGRFLAERAKEADVYTCTYTPRERDKFEGKIRALVQSLIDNGIDVKVYLD